MKILLVSFAVFWLAFPMKVAWAQETANPMQMADSLLNELHFKDAASLYKSIAKKSAVGSDAAQKLVKSYEAFAYKLMEEGQYQPAAIYFKKSLKAEKKYIKQLTAKELAAKKANYYKEVADAQYKIGEFQSAGRFYKRTLKLYAKNDIEFKKEEIYKNLAGCYVAIENYGLAGKYYRQVYLNDEEMEQTADAFYCEAEDLHTAVNLYKFLRLSSNNPASYSLQIGRAYWELQDIQNTIDWFSRVITQQDIEELEDVIEVEQGRPGCSNLKKGKFISENNQTSPLDVLHYAQALLNGRGQYLEARNLFNRITIRYKNSGIKSYKVINQTYYIEPLGDYINTDKSEFSPSFHPVDSSLVFVSDRDPLDVKASKINGEERKATDLYKIKLNEKDFAGMLSYSETDYDNTSGFVPTNFPERSSLKAYVPQDTAATYQTAEKLFDIQRELSYHEGPLTFFPNDPYKAIFTGNAFDSLQNLRADYRGDRFRYNTLKLFYAEWMPEDSIWHVEPLKFTGENAQLFNDVRYSVGHPTLTKDGKTLYFSSNAPIPQSKGNSDLYFVQWNEDSKSWDSPVNLGEKINTDANEVFPYLHTDRYKDESLYFSSNKLGTLGGLDIYKSVKIRNTFSEPINLGDSLDLDNSLNSPYDDFGIIMNESESYGFFTSARRGEGMQDDIFKFKVVKLEVLVLDRNDSIPISTANVAVYNMTDVNLFEAKPTDKKGFSRFMNFRLNKDFKIVGSAENYRSDSTYINSYIEQLPDDGVIRVKLFLDKSATAEIVVLANVKSEQQVFITFDKSPYELSQQLQGEELYELFYLDGFNFLANTKPDGNNILVDFLEPLPMENMENPREVQRLKSYLGNYNVEVVKVTNIQNIRYNFAVPDPERFPDRPVFEEKIVNVKPEDELKKVAEVLNRFPHLDVKLSSHTDRCPLNNENNQRYDNHALSVRRNMRATQSLMDKGIGATRIQKCAYEWRYPVDIENTYDLCKNDYNRRTEFKFIYRGREGYVLDCNCHDSQLIYIEDVPWSKKRGSSSNPHRGGGN